MVKVTPINTLTPIIIDFLTHFWPLLTKQKREYIMTKPCINNVFGSPLSIYEVVHCKTNMADLILKSSENLNFFLFFFFQMDKAYCSISNYGQRWTKQLQFIKHIFWSSSLCFIFSKMEENYGNLEQYAFFHDISKIIG